MKEVGSGVRLRVVLVLVDQSEVERLLLDIGRLAIVAGWTLICAASLPEAARYIETYKAYEHKPATAIRERVGDSYLDQASSLLTTVRSVNETDVRTLLSRFRSIAGIARATLSELTACPGIAEVKATRIYAAFHGPLVSGARVDGGGNAVSGTASGRSTKVVPDVIGDDDVDFDRDRERPPSDEDIDLT